MKAGLRRAIALSLGLCALTIPASAATTFTDVPSNYWGYSYITEAASKGLVSGTGNGQYQPEAALTQTQFVTMVCNMFYSTAVANQGTSSQWWLPYMNVARGAGLLTNTTIAQQYSANGWNASVDRTTITRYDMAQILANVATAQSWEAPDSLTLMYARLLIEDWDSIPSQYRNAVASSYARGFLTGDENRNFNGEASTTRAQAAVVLCALDESRTTITTPTYTNTNRLTNGLAATEVNVSDLLSGLRNTYPNYGSWNMDRSYTSRVLGTGTGSRAFTYMLSDQVFGAMRSTRLSDPKDLRVGDVVTLSGGQYGLVASTNDTSFTYVTCNSSGVITWGNTMNLRSLSSSNTVYTRYGSLPAGDNTLTDGSRATESNVSSLLRDLEKDYEQGDRWDEDYDSDELGNGDRHSKGFAFCISDEVFGDLESTRVRDVDDLRIGDLIGVSFDNEDDEDDDYRYGIILDIDGRSSGSTFYYASLDEDGDIDWDLSAKIRDIDEDYMYTRYPDEDKDQADDELTNGDPVEEKYVDDLLGEVLDDFDEDKWDLEDEYNSNVFPDADGSEGFAYYISDEIFGDLDYEDVSKPEYLRVGDVICVDGQWGVVESEDGDGCTYVTIDNSGVDYVDFDYSDEEYIEEMYTRYLDDNSADDLEDKISAELDDLYDSDKYDEGVEWDEKYYDSDELGKASGYDESFAFELSDDLFGNRDHDVMDWSDIDEYLRVGDIIYDEDGDVYGVVTQVQLSRDRVRYVGLDSDNEIVWDQTVKPDDIDEFITRY